MEPCHDPSCSDFPARQRGGRSRAEADAGRPRAVQAAGGLLDRGSISLRQRELVILRITAMLGAEYEWGVPVAYFAEKAKFTPAEIAATVHGDAADWVRSEEAILVRIVGALTHAATLDDALWAEAQAHFDGAQMIEILALVGFYHLVSFTVNATGVALEPDAATGLN